VKDALGNVQRILVLGGTSEIALATVRALARGRPGVQVALAARPSDRRAAAAAALAALGIDAVEVDFDATDRASYERAIGSVFDTGGDVDVVLLAFGLLGDQERAWQDLDAALELAEVGYSAAVGCGVLVAGRLRAQGHGAIVVMSSVAGQRPRRSNFVYGSTKAGLDAFYTGLRIAVAGDGVQVMVVRPGFVRSRMTAGLKVPPLALTPDQVASLIAAGLRAGRSTVWAPPAMQWVMLVLRLLPGPLFRRLRV
jgi:decaprenylphospho-beta-D-erythro-pentofuranosid-2-ulose 2-reductase